MSKENGTEHPLGEEISPPARAKNGTFATETFGGKIHVEWDPTAAVTPIGQLPFFIQFLKVGGLLVSLKVKTTAFRRSDLSMIL
jgi:hypothetical protein